MTGEGWRKSSYSAANGDCGEVLAVTDGILMRDSRDPDGPVLVVAAGARAAFTSRLKGAAGP